MYETRPWLKQYPQGVPANINPHKYATLIDFAEEAMESFKGLIAFTCMDANLRYEQLDDYSRSFAAYLHSRGLRPGDKIALMMPNLLQYPIAIFGALRAGLIIVNTNPLYTPREMEHQFIDSGVKAIVIAENFAANLEQVIAKTSIEVVITTSIGEMLGTLKGAFVNFVIRNIKRKVPRYSIPNTVCFTEALKQGKGFSILPFDRKNEDVILLQYTGGTTGISKGTMLTNLNLCANLEQIRAVICYALEERKETTLSPLPMYHIFAFAVNILAMMSIGARTVLIVNPRDIPTVVNAFKKYPISLMTGVNTLYNALLNNTEFVAMKFPNLKASVAGGMALQSSVATKWKAITGTPITEGYGLTETSPVAMLNPLNENARLGCIGLPVPSTDIRLVDDTGGVSQIGQPGEIQIKGPQVMKGYYNKPDETAASIVDGWLLTGDIGVMDSEGFFRIVDRKKDMILVSGFNVYPNEIEDVACMHPKVLEAGAVAMKDDKCGEVVKLFIVKKDQSLTEDELMQHCRANLTNYKLPKVIVFKKELPKTPIGKILRRELKD